MLPHMDDDSMQAVEKDGRSGWVDGPCLWLNHQRFAVGTVNGKPRRPDSEIAGMKPVVYAADRTDEPVHAGKGATHQRMESAADHEKPAPPVYKEEATPTDAEKKTSPPLVPVTSSVVNSINPSHPTVSYQNQNPNEMPTQAAEVDALAAQSEKVKAEEPVKAQEVSKLEEPVRAHETTKAGGPATAAAVPVPHVPRPASEVESTNTATSGEEKKKKLRLSHLFHHKNKSVDKHIDNTTPIKHPNSQNANQTAIPGRTTGTAGQVNMHESLINDVTTKKMEGESVSVIASPITGSKSSELLVASDPAKGLAVDLEKLNNGNGQVKPPMERFVTAAEGLTTVNGQL